MASAKTCAKCGEAIVGQVLKVGSEDFHPACFCCGVCAKPITGAFKLGEGGMRLCDDCVPKSYCAGCKAPIEGEVLNFGSKKYHPSCFKCNVCDKPITGACYPDGDALRCKACAEGGGGNAAGGTGPSGASEAAAGIRIPTGKLCRKCKQPIDGETVLGDGDDAFHPDCFVCAACQGPMEEFMLDDSRRYFCKPCATKGSSKAEGKEITMVAGNAAAALPTCCICGEGFKPSSDGDSESEALALVDGSVLHWRCFRCSSCGAQEDRNTVNATLLRSKVLKLKKGEYRCDGCRDKEATEIAAAPASIQDAAKVALVMLLGTYFGKASQDDDAEWYSITLAPDSRCALEVSTGTAKSRAEGSYTEDFSGTGGGVLRFQVSKGEAPGPSVGDTLEFAVQPGSSSKGLSHNGVGCELLVGVPAFELRQLHNRAPRPAAQAAAPAEAPATYTGILTLEELQDAGVWKEKGVDPGTREQNLSDSEFATLFGTSKADFAKLPKWKRDAKKKEHKLF